MPDSDLRADCSQCFGLCCVVPAFLHSSDFAIDKPAGTPCPNLRQDSRCGIHAELRERGFVGCTVYDCFGAGQHVSQKTFAGRDWRAAPEIRASMFAAFTAVEQLHELVWYLDESVSLAAARPVRAELARMLGRTRALTEGTAEDLVALDVAAHRSEVDVLLRRVSELVRAGAARGVDHRHADLIGAQLRDADLRGANLRGALLIGADLRGADLRLADVIGADLRGCDLRGASLTETLFLTQFQVAAATGDRDTLLPPALERPAHWLREPLSLTPVNRRRARRR